MQWCQIVIDSYGICQEKSLQQGKSEFQKLKDEFLLEVSMDEIPADLVINFDQTALSYVPTSLWTMEQEGTIRPSVYK